MNHGNFTEGKIFLPLLEFALPVLLALFLQSLYGAVDLLVVGQFATSADVSAVATGSQIMFTVTNVVASLAMGTTVLIGQQMGAGHHEDAGRTMGTSIVFFTVLALILGAAMVAGTKPIAHIMNAPDEAFDMTCDYMRICSFGMVFIVGYNLIGSLFRGLGNSKLPLLTVAIAAVINIFGDLFCVCVLHMGAAGAAAATVASQAFSLLISYLLIRRMELPFPFSKKQLKWNGDLIRRVTGLGFPIALSDFLVGLSFLVIVAIVNVLGVTASAGVGVAEKVCGFIMLVPSAFGQSMAAFAAQNYGAGKLERARKGLLYGLAVSWGIGAIMAYLSFFHGDLLCGIFAREPDVIAAGWQYLKAYGIDCLLTPIFFNLAGYFNGCGRTRFVMAENLIGGIGIRLPVSYLMSKVRPVSLFRIGLATPMASFVQNVLCVVYFVMLEKQQKRVQGVQS
ncbi:MAG: MATE family efflux transporter [Lactimicrobium massiliense]|nr:MATE family efflux transporter [Lactimicrobium massiliense]MDD6458587.1 MATE family efflux transporter [Lactimicrobium massiliense]